MYVLLFLLLVAVEFISFPSWAQQLSPIIPANRGVYGSPYAIMGNPYAAGGQMPYPGLQNQPFFNQQPPGRSAYPSMQPINGQPPWPNSMIGQQESAFRQNAALMQGFSPFGQQSPPSTVGMSSISGMEGPINAYSNQMPAESPYSSPLTQRRASMPPIQVVYGKPVPMEMQAEQQSATQPSASSSSSLPLFLQGASEDVINEVCIFARKNL